MSDPYKILGVSKRATGAEIKSAFRKLAKKHHPDLDSGDPERFKEINSAYDILSDAAKRAKYDRGEIGSSGNERPGAGFWKAWTGRGRTKGAGETTYTKGSHFDFDDILDDDDIFAEFFRSSGQEGSGSGGGSAANSRARKQSSVTNYKLKVPFVEAMAGLRKRVTLSDGKTVNMLIPPGTEDGTKLRLKGQGRIAPGGKTPGDAVIEISIEPHEYFKREGGDILVEIPVTLYEAVLGASIIVPTTQGNVTLRVPKNSNNGTRLRLKGKGVPGAKGRVTGDQYVTLHIVLPDGEDADLTEFAKGWAEKRGYNPRHKMKFT